MQKTEIKENILDACSENDCPVWLVGEVGQLLNAFEDTVISEIKKECGKDIGRIIEAMKQSYPMSKADYVDFDVFFRRVMKKFAEMQVNNDLEEKINMLIRSQDKGSIKNFSLISDLVISKNRNRWEIVACYPYFAQSDCGFSTIGEYSTEKKAIKVLDDICSFANGLHFKKIATDKCGRLDGVVFQMPQDDEVN